MLLIFGLSAFFRTVSEGIFHCPNCGGDRRYRRRAGRRWFTLFFLPVIPLNQLGEIVECGACRTRFNETVLRLPTAEQMAAVLPAGMRAAIVAILRAGDPTDEAPGRLAIDAVRGYGDAGYDDDALDVDMQMASDVVDDLISQAGEQLAVEAKEWFLAQVVRIALADGPIDDAERLTLHHIAGGLGMTQAHALGVIATTESAAR